MGRLPITLSRPTEGSNEDRFLRRLLERLRSDEDAAARDVFQRFARRLVALTRRQFEPRLAHRVDPEDVVQSAFKSFFVRHREGKLQVGDWDNLWGLLTLITLRKCADRVEYLRADGATSAARCRPRTERTSPGNWPWTGSHRPRRSPSWPRRSSTCSGRRRRRAAGPGVEPAGLHGGGDRPAARQGLADRPPPARADPQAAAPVARGREADDTASDHVADPRTHSLRSPSRPRVAVTPDPTR